MAIGMANLLIKQALCTNCQLPLLAMMARLFIELPAMFFV